MTSFLDLFAGGKGSAWYADMVALAARLTTVTNALEGLAVTSSSSVTPATGALAFTTDQTATDRPLAVGATVRGRSAADASKYFVGTVSAFSGTALTVNATFAAGAGAVTDWVIAYEASYALRLALDTDPTLAADLDASGFSISALLDLTMTGSASIGGDAAVAGALSGGSLAIAGTASFADRVRIAQAGEHATGAATATAGAVTVTSASPAIMTDTLGGDRTYNVAGAWTPGHAYTVELQVSQDGTGARAVTVQPLSIATNSLAVNAGDGDAGWSASQVSVAEDVAAPWDGPGELSGWTITANGGGGAHLVSARRGGAEFWASGDYSAVSAMLLQAGVTSRVRVACQSDTFARGGYADFDLAAGTVLSSGNIGAGTLEAAGIVPCVGGWAGWHVCWIAIDATAGSIGGDGVSSILYLADAGGAVSFTPAGTAETVLLGGLTLHHGSTYRGFQNVGATRAGMVSWRDPAAEIDFAGQAANTASRVLVSVGPDGAILLDNASITI